MEEKDTKRRRWSRPRGGGGHRRVRGWNSGSCSRALPDSATGALARDLVINMMTTTLALAVAGIGGVTPVQV